MESDIAPRDILMNAFPGIEEREATEIVACGKVIEVPAGTAVCHEGEYEQTFYIILKGQVAAIKGVGTVEERRLNLLGRDEFFGEMAIIGDAPRAATVTTLVPSTLLEIHKEAFTGVLQINNMVLLAIARAVSQRLRANNNLATEDLRLKAKELADAYQQLAEEDYARSQFLSTIAHELRTPLTAANGFLQVIRLGMLQGESLENALDTVSRNLQEIISLTNDILFLQEMEMILPQFQEVNIGTILTSTIEQMRAKAQENKVGVNLLISPSLPVIKGHAKSLQRAFAAILDNAIKFSPDGGMVSITVSREEDNRVKIAIEDQGVGIPVDVQPRVFQRFFHVDQIGQHLFGGIGIGLSIARQVIKQHHGTITVQSEVGQGSTFCVYLKGD